MRSPRNTASIVRDLEAIVPDEPLSEGSEAAGQRIAERLVQSLRPVAPLPSRTTLVGAFLSIFAAVTALLFAFVGTRGTEHMTSYNSPESWSQSSPLPAWHRSS